MWLLKRAGARFLFPLILPLSSQPISAPLQSTYTIASLSCRFFYFRLFFFFSKICFSSYGRARGKFGSDLVVWKKSCKFVNVNVVLIC